MLGRGWAWILGKGWTWTLGRGWAWIFADNWEAVIGKEGSFGTLLDLLSGGW